MADFDCPVQKQNSNDSSLHVAEEDCLTQLPGDPNGPRPSALPTWYEQEPNEYSDFGQEVTTTARAPLKANRSNLKGTPTDIDASGGWNMDVTKTNTARMMQGFMFADARAFSSNAPLNVDLKANFRVVDGKFVFDPLDNPDDVNYILPLPGALIVVSGFETPSNNGQFMVQSVNKVDRTVTVVGTLTDEDVGSSGGLRVFMDTVGFNAAGSDDPVVATVVNGQLVVTNDALSAIAVPGLWLFLGGDSTASKPGANVGYARIALDFDRDTEFGTLRFDLTTFKPVAGSYPVGQAIEIYVPVSIANGKEADQIKRRSYTIRRGLGYDETGEQAEYLIGSVPNELTLNISGQSLLNADLTFVSVDYQTKAGGESGMTGDILPARGEAAYNTSSNVFAVKLYIHDKNTSQPSALFGYLQEGTITINNGVTPDKAVGVMGAFDTSAGNFTVGGELTAYFTTVAAAAAIRNNADVGLYNIFAADNAGFVADIPLLGLGGGRINVAKDEAITIPLTVNAAQSASLETLTMQYFQYLPNVAMPK